ncbi:type II toxin-antitoxin system PemK/MazF family toxin [Geoalkalibacter halelectricus]|uniref:Type II toxin-antitoxin system PemK/MazF family toxin n=1 Tax=Geoalkalibacter halelectricus TaxID=2847045 RepID=A0ABY5ZSN8_9BACT|nr:type II toxin-antitoxin system PemK/MazF family toxin [Geoalkalibacter halelectricus]MDO3377958.1 type II toxin-antitoxin system PemK/MazF family toxin [Geoalkalibacter halelectricus]UWZ81539.1 type II toxin-antitoxin system PemK/MazF family toxin [Geoalkalibacter halelectricus]
MKRGDLVQVALPGAFGKPRPALIVQSDLFAAHPSVTICLLTSHPQPTPLFRHTIEPNPENGLTTVSQIQVDKLMTLPRAKLGQVIGRLTKQQMQEVTQLLALWVGIAG